ncbi:chromosome 15 C3orf86 homolog [Callithrix jacchus]|uniref:chromosome 15 C3orf86 homolog n=1 Tax=Callithrix jacchus TaxID=9483 RepID=UPI00159DB79D
MSRSQFGQGQKPLDKFFWVNEISGEITYPPQKADAPAVPPERRQERPPSQPRSAQGAPCSPQGPPAQRPAPAPPPKASLKDSGTRKPHPSVPTWGRAKAGGGRSPPPFSAIPVTISSPGGTLPVLGPLGPAPQPLVSTFPLSTSAPWAFTYKLKNVPTKK